MKVFVLAIDGLEHYFVEEWKLRNLMQKTHGNLKVREEYFHGEKGKGEHYEPYTPTIWVSFITGKDPEIHKVRDWKTYGPLLDWIRKKPPLSWIKGKRRLTAKLGILPRYVSKGDWKEKLDTIFDLVKPSIALFVPAYSESENYRKELFHTLYSEGVDEYTTHAWEVHRQRVEVMLQRTSEDWRLFMAWLDLLDLIGHSCYGRRFWEFRKAYKSLNDLVPRIKHNLSGDVIFLIVSDHGMKGSSDGVTGRHSDNAFWSLDIETDWRPKGITDFYPKILEWCEE